MQCPTCGNEFEPNVPSGWCSTCGSVEYNGFRLIPKWSLPGNARDRQIWEHAAQWAYIHFGDGQRADVYGGSPQSQTIEAFEKYAAAGEPKMEIPNGKD